MHGVTGHDVMPVCTHPRPLHLHTVYYNKQTHELNWDMMVIPTCLHLLTCTDMVRAAGWSCTSWENVSAAVDAVRADLPRGEAILYYNEAYPVLAFEKCDTGGDFDPNRTNFSYPRVPKGLDWISLDYYPDEGTLKGTPLLFQQHLYPKMAEHQKALFVPPAYGCHGDAACSNRLCCNNSTRDGPNTPCDGDCSVAMLQWAKGSYNWARSDPRIVGLNPWWAPRT